MSIFHIVALKDVNNVLHIANPVDFGKCYKLYDQSVARKPYSLLSAVLNKLSQTPCRVYWVSDYGGNQRHFTKQQAAELWNWTSDCERSDWDFDDSFVLNRTKKLAIPVVRENAKYALLPYLCEDFPDNDIDSLTGTGSWAGDLLSVSKEIPEEYTLVEKCVLEK